MSAQKPTAAGVPRTGAPSEAGPTRKTWTRKSSVDVVLAQIRRQEDRVTGLQEELAREKRELEKLQKAKEVLEAK